MSGRWNVSGGAEDRWNVVDESIWSDEKVRAYQLPNGFKKISLDNGWNPVKFRTHSSVEKERARTFNTGMAMFDEAWKKHAKILPLTLTPGPCVRALITEWGHELDNNTGITGSPIPLIIELHTDELLIDRSTPQLYRQQHELLFLPACHAAWRQLIHHHTANEAVYDPVRHEQLMKRVILKKALQDAYPALKSL